MELEKTILLEEVCWRQKSRALWLREGRIKIPSSSTRLLILTEVATLWSSWLSMALLPSIHWFIKELILSALLRE
jgi:hypothetical protein